MPEPRVVAFHLPQYHPIPENDEWWGAGFTEWRNVVNARPRFRGHTQPHLPADLGFYDLRVPEARAAQAELARGAGIAAFCYYHYWFGGRRLLQRPVDEILRTGEPDFPFFLCWANENWTRRWDGLDHEVLIGQSYSEADDRAHIRSLLPAFADPRYLRVDGKPVFVVYRSDELPEPRRTTDVWRTEAAKEGLELHLCRVESYGGEHLGPPADDGFDAAIDRMPDWSALINRPRLRRDRLSRALAKAHLADQGYRFNRVYAYRDFVRWMADRPEPGYLRYGCVTPRWDNSPRRERWAVILTDDAPDVYGEWLRREIERAGRLEQPLVFVNAWNEWAEGNHLEPCERWGHAYLEATRSAVGATEERPSG